MFTARGIVDRCRQIALDGHMATGCSAICQVIATQVMGPSAYHLQTSFSQFTACGSAHFVAIELRTGQMTQDCEP